METRVARSEPPLIVIAGPTASGKTALAIELAQKYDGEIICADSRTIYRDMTVGTAKPTVAEQLSVPHWGLDLASPGERFTAADFKRYAVAKIADIRQRGHVPFLVGGTGLYIDGVVFDYTFGPDVDDSERAVFEAHSIEELREYCYKNNIKLPENDMNKRYLIRTIEQNGSNEQRRHLPIKNCIIVGIATERELLRARIRQRTEHLFDAGVVGEARMLGKKYGWDSEAMTGNIYPLLHQYFDGVLTLEEVKQRFITLDWRLAKRQLTWLRRNKFIRWYDVTSAKTYLSSVLSEH